MNGKMKIGIIINELYVGGAQRLVVDEVNEMIRLGIDVSLITLQPARGKQTFEHLCRLPAASRHALFVRSLFDIPAVMTLARLLKREKFDVVVTHLWLSNTTGRIAAYFAKTPRVFSFEHNVYDHLKSARLLWIDRILQRCATRIIAVSCAVRDSLVRHGIAPEKIVVLPNAVPLAHFAKGGREFARHAFGVPRGSFVFITVGRLTKQKGHDNLLRAFSLLDGTSHLIIVGEGELRQDIERLINELHIEGRVHLLGERTNISALMHAADCFVFPSRWEGVGIAMIEALAAGLPVIATNFDAAKEVVTHGENGLIAPIDEPQSLAEHMRQVESSPSLREHLASRARPSVARYAIEAHVQQLLAIFQNTELAHV